MISASDDVAEVLYISDPIGGLIVKTLARKFGIRSRVVEFPIQVRFSAEYLAMKTTVDLPDELLRQADTEAARRGLGLADLLLRRVLPPAQRRGTRWDTKQAEARPEAVTSDLSALMSDGLGIIDSGVDDLASHPRQMEGFGRDSLGHR